MSFQINLLEEEEVRDTSRVSRKFMMILGGAGFVAVLFASVLFTSWRLRSVEGELADQKSGIEDLKPAYERALKIKESLGWREDALSELESWRNSSVDVDVFLADVGGHVPENIQLLNMHFMGNLVRRPARAELAAGVFREYQLKLSGQAVGEGADSDVLEYIRDLQEDESFKELLTTSRLQSMRSASKSGADQAIRAFSIVCDMEARLWH